jgi:polysaccharide biosynthesis/export protein ExoF
MNQVFQSGFKRRRLRLVDETGRSPEERGLNKTRLCGSEARFSDKLSARFCTTLLRAFVFSAIAFGAGRSFAAPSQNGYQLGPQDKLEVRVFDVRPGSGEIHEWPAFNGSYLIDATGNVSLPVIGEVPALDKTTAQLANDIAKSLQSRIGLAQIPAASVQVVQYRPFYITGAVERPGAYEYRPQLTVIQAISIAGGMIRPADGELMGYERDILTQQGQLRLLGAQKLALLLREARLEAEITDATSMQIPADVKADAKSPDTAKAIEAEQMLFESQREAFESQITSIQQSKSLFSQELTALAAKDTTLGRQLELSKKELGQINGLVSKGLAVVPQQLASEQSNAAFESSRLDLQLATLRAQQSFSNADRDILDVRSKWRTDALTQEEDVRGKLAEAERRIKTTQALIAQSATRAPGGADDAYSLQPTYVLSQKVDGVEHVRTVSKDDPISAGDVLQVILPVHNGAADGSSDSSGGSDNLKPEARGE